MVKLPPPQSSPRVPFLQRQDWLISAGLVLVLYVVMLIMIYYYTESHILKYLVHLLPLMAVGMAWKGIKDRDEKLSRERAIRAKRRHAEMDLKKLTKPQNPAGADSAGEEKKK